MEAKLAVEVRGLGKKYGKLAALEKLNFDIYKGEIFGLAGPNGAGKSTFISVVTSLGRPTSGDVIVNSFSVSRQRDSIKRFIGFVPQDIALYPTLTGYDNLNFWAGIYGIRGALKKQRVNEALSVVKLEDRAKDRVAEYSGGMKRRLNIAVALLHHPDILVMDEPTVGVDIQSRQYILETLRDLKKEGRTVIFTSHDIEEMELICDRIAVMDRGAVVSIGTPEELMESYGAVSLKDMMMKSLAGFSEDKREG